MAQETIEIDIRAWLVRILKNWYWFLLSAMGCAVLSGMDLLAKFRNIFS